MNQNRTSKYTSHIYQQTACIQHIYLAIIHCVVYYCFVRYCMCRTDTKIKCKPRRIISMVFATPILKTKYLFKVSYKKTKKLIK